MNRPSELSTARSLFDTGDFRLSYSLIGHGPPVVFIQGVGLHGEGWRPQTEMLADRFTCLAFDNPGIGRSFPVPAELTVPSLAAAVLALLDHLEWESAHFVGHSLGSLIAVEAAALAPSRVRSLALLCSVVRGRDATRATWPIIRLGVASMLGAERFGRSDRAAPLRQEVGGTPRRRIRVDRRRCSWRDHQPRGRGERPAEGASECSREHDWKSSTHGGELRLKVSWWAATG